MPESTADQLTLREQATDIVSAHVAQNADPVAELPNLIRSVHHTPSTLGQLTPAEPSTASLNPAIPVRKSIKDDYIISLEDGRKLKGLKRYLGKLGMTPAGYRAK